MPCQLPWSPRLGCAMRRPAGGQKRRRAAMRVAPQAAFALSAEFSFAECRHRRRRRSRGWPSHHGCQRRGRCRGRRRESRTPRIGLRRRNFRLCLRRTPRRLPELRQACRGLVHCRPASSRGLRRGWTRRGRTASRSATPPHDGPCDPKFLAEPAVAGAVLVETSAARTVRASVLGLFSELVEPLAPRVARPALRWLRAKAYERLGDLEQAEVHPAPRSRWIRRGR